MANLVLADEMLAELLDEQTGHSSAHGWDNSLAMLFTNNITPGQANVKADYTEANNTNFPGYVRITLVAANFPGASVSGHVATTTYSVTLTWTRSSTGTPLTVYGIAILNAAGTKVIAAGNFDSGPYVVASSGDAINETVTLRRTSEFT